VCNDLRWFEKGTPFERRGRKATGLRGLSYDSGVANMTVPGGSKPVPQAIRSQSMLASIPA
jgi:hypothetical protein